MEGKKEVKTQEKAKGCLNLTTYRRFFDLLIVRPHISDGNKAGNNPSDLRIYRSALEGASRLAETALAYHSTSHFVQLIREYSCVL